MSPPEARIAVLGAGGQLGRALTAVLGARGVGLTHAEFDLLQLSAAAATLERLRPVAVINAAAYTAVDRAETEAALAFRVNADAPGFLARWCSERNIPFVHFSSDYVFSGQGERPWTEEDPVAPLNVYGQTKLEGERQVAAAGGRWLIFRTQWVYDEAGRNFLTAMLRLAQERETLTVVDDQWGAPTYAVHLAVATVAALDAARTRPLFPSGIYHACNAGETTWCGFAHAIVAHARAAGGSLRVRSISPITTAAYGAPARRPLNGRLSTRKLKSTLHVALPPWEASLADCMQRFSLPAAP